MKEKVKEPIRLREKVLSNGQRSLYLDIYVNGKRKYEFLKLYLLDGDSRQVKEKNRETLRLADAIKAKRIVELRNGQYGFQNDYSKRSFIDYFEANISGHSDSLMQQLKGTLHHIRDYTNGKDVTFGDIDVNWLNGFRAHLLSTLNKKSACEPRPLARNTADMYFSKVLASVRRAMRNGYITTNPIANVENIKREETERKFLTFEEVRKMAASECANDKLKRAFLFSCLTGIRRCDIERMTWGEVSDNGDFTRVTFRQKKTGGQMYLDINGQAVAYMGERKSNSEYVFGKFYDGRTSALLQAWAGAAGVNKEITFHAARHTFAVLMLETGSDIYTLKDLLGHKGIQATQIYAKVLDKTKQNAVNRIPSLFDEDVPSPSE